MDPVLATKMALSLSDKQVVKKLIYIIGTLILLIVTTFIIFPLVILISIIAILNPIDEDLQKDVFYQSINEIKAEYSIQNDLSAYIAKSTDYAYTGDLTTSKESAYYFVLDYFVVSQEIEVEVESETEIEVDGETTTVTESSTETITVYYFKTLTEIIDMLLSEPFNFTQEDIELIQSLYFDEADIDITLKGKYPMPVNGYVSSGYGNRTDPLSGKYFMHPALDIVPEHHAPIISIADGTVVSVITTQGNIYGNNVTIRHEQNGEVFYSFSAHLSKVNVKNGQSVSQGEVIGLEGGDPNSDPNPGRTTGHHLHFEIWTGSIRATHVNPSLYLGE